MELVLQKKLTVFSRQKQPPEVLYKKSWSSFFFFFGKSAEKYLSRSLFLNKIASVGSGTLLRKRLRCFPATFVKYLEHFFAEAEHLRVTASEGLWAFYPILQKLVDVRLGSKYTFYIQCKPIAIWCNFLPKRFFRTGYWNLDFNSINSTKYILTSR